MPRKKQFNVSQTSSPIPEETARRRGRPPKRFLDEGYSPPTTNKKKVPVPKKLLGKTPKASKGRPRERRKYSDDDFRGVDYPSESEESNSNDEDEVEVEREQSEGLEEVSDVEDVSKSDADVTEASIFCPWAELDPEDIPTLELPEGSADIPLPIFFLMDAIEIYEILRSFSRTLRLTPFIFEDFCAALNAPDNSCILAEIHISLMRMSLKNDDEEQTNYSVNDTNNAFNIMNHCLETMTYAEVLRQYIAAYPGVDESVLIAINADNYPYCGVESRIIVLLFLCYRFLYSQGYKKIVNNNGRIQSDDACRLCGKSTGIPVNCSRCEASFHADCVGQEDLPSDFVCQLCTLNVVHGVSDALPIGESAEREPLRLTPIGRDRHGRTYWFVVRRLFVQSEEDENDVRYYSSAPQLVELIRKLDPDYFEFDLCQFISEHINDFFEQMSQTLELTAERREKAEKDISIRTVKPENYESVLSIAYLQQDNLKRMSQILRECVAKVALNGTNGDGEKVQESLSECVISLLGIYDGRLVNSFWSGNFEEEQVLVYEESEPLDPELFFRMGDSKFDVGYNQYVNHYANNEMAESVQTRKKLADRKKYMGTRFSLNDDAEWSFEWSTAKGYGMYGNARLHAKYIEWTMGKLMRKIPPELMHRKWPSIAEEYEANLKQAGTYEKLASSLLNLECAMRRTLFLPQWWNSLGHTSLTRSTPEQREQQSRDLQKRKKEEKDIISSEFDESIVKVNYTKSPNPAVLRQKGEVYRSGGRGELGGWLWTSRTRVTASEKPEKPPLGITTYTSDEQLTTKAAKKAKRLECVVERMWDKPKWTIQTSADDQHSFSVLSQCYSPLCKAYQYKRLVCYGSSDSLAQSCYSSLCRNKMFKQVKIEDSKELIVKEIKMEQNQVMGEDIPWPIPELNSFEQRRTKKRSILVVAKAILRKLAKTAGRVPVYIPGFSTTAKSNYQVWNYPCPRPCFDLCWRWLTTNAHSLHAVALQLKILWASIRWMDMEPEDNDPDRRVVVHLHDHDERRWIVAHKEFPPFGTYERYLLKIEVIPLDEENEEEDEPWSGRNERKQRTSTRKRRTGSRIRKPQFEKEEWIDGVELKLYEIKDYWAKLNRPPATEEKPATKPINRITNGAAFSLNIEERKKRTAQRVNRDDYVYDTDPQYNDDNSFVTPQVKRPRPQPLSVASQDMDPNGYQNMTVRDAFKIQANRVYSYFPSRRTSSGFEYDGGMIRGGGRVQMPVGDGSTMRRVVFSGHGGQVAEEAVAASSLGLQDVDEVPPVIPRYDGNEQRQAAPLRQVIYATTSGQQQGNRPVYVLKRPDNQLTTGPYVVRSTNSGERVAEMSSNSLILQPGNRLVAFRTPNTARAGQMMVNPQQGTRLVRLSNGAVGRPVPVGATRYVQQVNGDGVRRVMIQNRPANFVSPQDYDGNTETFGQQRIAVASGSMSTPRFLRGGATMQMAKQQSYPVSSDSVVTDGIVYDHDGQYDDNAN